MNPTPEKSKKQDGLARNPLFSAACLVLIRHASAEPFHRNFFLAGTMQFLDRGSPMPCGVFLSARNSVPLRSHTGKLSEQTPAGP